jgi:hypothetical protein
MNSTLVVEKPRADSCAEISKIYGGACLALGVKIVEMAGIAIESSIARFGVGAGGISCVSLGNDLNEYYKYANSTGATNAIDPNMKIGPAGVGPEQYVGANGTLPYLVEFSNDPAQATAPAQHVRVVDQLDSDLDWSAFKFEGANVAGLDVPVTVNGNHLYGQVTVPFNGGTLVTVEGFFDPTTGKVDWTFAGPDGMDDPFTPTPYRDFLPPDVNAPEGEGFVRYSVKPRAGLATGMRIDNIATIIFDEHDGGGSSLDTNPVFNTIDGSAPASRVDSLAQSGSDLAVGWSGTDASGSGVQDYSIYVSKDGGPFRPWLLNTTETSGTYTAEAGHEYAFFSLSHDAAGNSEHLKTAADVSTAADTDGDTIPDVSDPDDDNDGCPDQKELQTAAGSELTGGRRDPRNRWDYFNPTHDGQNRVDDILAVVQHFGKNQGDPGYSTDYDRTYVGPNLWNLGPPNGRIRVTDILAAVYQYHHDCS